MGEGLVKHLLWRIETALERKKDTELKPGDVWDLLTRYAQDRMH